MTMQDEVEALVADIPPGRVMTYGDIADCVGHPGAARMVGLIAHQGTSGLPWQRVVNHKGGLASSYPEQAAALAAEGVTCRDGRVTDFRHRRWLPDFNAEP